MREYLQQLYGFTALQWDEWDGDRYQFAVLYQGRLICADSVPLLILALREATPRNHLRTSGLRIAA